MLAASGQLFLHQAGWHKEAQKELDNLVEEYSSKKDEVAGLLLGAQP